MAARFTSPLRITFAALAALVFAAPALGQTPTPQGPSIAVAVTSFSPWNDSDHPLQVDLRITNTGQVPITDLRVRVAMHNKVLTRSELGQSLDGHPQDETGSGPSDAITDELAPAGVQPYSFNRPLTDFSNSFRKRPGSPAGGVYPIEIQVRGSGQRLWTAWTAVVFIASSPESRLNVGWVLPVHQPSIVDPDGTIAAGVADAALGPHGTERRMAAAIASTAGTAVTLAPTPLTLDELADVAGGYERRESSRVIAAAKTDAVPRGAAEALANIKAAVTSLEAEVATVPYSRADLIMLVHGGLEDDAEKQLKVGIAQTKLRAGRAPNELVLVPANMRIDSRAAAFAAADGVHTVVLDSTVLPPQQGQFGFGPDQPITVSGRGGVLMTALLVDDGIRSRLESADQHLDPVLQAQAVVAQTASAWFERPKFAGARAIVIATNTTPPPQTISALSAAFRGAPWLSLRSASQLVEAVPAAQDPQPLRLDGALDTDQLKAARTAHRAINDVLSRVLVNATDDINLLQRRVLAGESADWSVGARGAEICRAAKTFADRTIAKIQAAGRNVTLTSRTGHLPVTILNGTKYTVRVQVRLSSAKVIFPDGERWPVEVGPALSPQQRRANTITVPAKARAAGSFGVSVELRTPDGAFPIGAGELVIRSTAVSAVALIAVGGGLLFIIGSWIRRGRRRARTEPPKRQRKKPRHAQPGAPESPQAAW